VDDGVFESHGRNWFPPSGLAHDEPAKSQSAQCTADRSSLVRERQSAGGKTECQRQGQQITEEYGSQHGAFSNAEDDAVPHLHTDVIGYALPGFTFAVAEPTPNRVSASRAVGLQFDPGEIAFQARNDGIALGHFRRGSMPSPK
jgi:hypothetical protein